MKVIDIPLVGKKYSEILHRINKYYIKLEIYVPHSINEWITLEHGHYGIRIDIKDTIRIESSNVEILEHVKLPFSNYTFTKPLEVLTPALGKLLYKSFLSLETDIEKLNRVPGI